MHYISSDVTHPTTRDSKGQRQERKSSPGRNGPGRPQEGVTLWQYVSAAGDSITPVDSSVTAALPGDLQSSVFRTATSDTCMLFR